MSEFIFKKGNTGIIDMSIVDRNGDPVLDLAATTEITFQVKATETGAALFSCTKTAAEIVVDTPNAGDVRITISPTKMTQIPKRYYCALKLVWSATVTYEVHIYVDDVETESFRIEQNIVS